MYFLLFPAQAEDTLNLHFKRRIIQAADDSTSAYKYAKWNAKKRRLWKPTRLF